ncbi:MAG: iron-containing alcohol dehydrogenase [Candidatus Handelsmanbacteria bacterium]|nr:iron-containing alcohol dehydrogenase [Candidatus Handelsmanbacteria bacterium]
MPFRNLFDFRLPTCLVHGPGSIKRLGEFLPAGQKSLIVTDPGPRSAGVVDKAIAALDASGIPHACFDEVLGNPSASCVQAAHRRYTREKCGSILGLGGGSPMDVAKMVAVLASHGGRVEDYLGAGKVVNDLPPLVCIPTTYGTGSEVTPFAVLNNPKTKNKDPIISWKIVPRAGILDPELCVALPASVGGPTGMDALTHALESYINLMATPITEGLALQAIGLVGRNLRLACANDHELEATGQMLLASAMAGMAFSQTRLGNVHAMSHAAGGHFEIHHGLCNAILLPYVLEFNLSARPEKFAAIAGGLGVNTAGLSARQAAEAAVGAVRQLNCDLGIPVKLGEAGVKASAIASMAKVAMTSGNIAVNPRRTTLKDMERLFAAAV